MDQNPDQVASAIIDSFNTGKPIDLDTGEAPTDEGPWWVSLRSSGTTGAPKPILLSHEQVAINARWMAEAVGFGRGHRHTTFLSFRHCNAAFFSAVGCAISGASLVLPGEALSYDQMFDFIESRKIESVSLAPIILRGMLKTGRKLPDCVRSILTASAPLTPAIARAAFDRWGSRAAIIRQGYGMAELVNFSTLMPDLSTSFREWAAAYLAPPTGIIPVGLPLGDTSIAFRLGEGEGEPPLDFYPVSRIILSSEALGIVGHDSGDIGCMTPQGLCLTGRTQETINRGGLTISPVCLENSWCSSGMTGVAFATESGVLGQDIGICSPEASVAWDIPTVVTEPVPRTVTGKPRRREISKSVPAMPEIDRDRMTASLKGLAEWSKDLPKKPKCPRTAYMLQELERQYWRIDRLPLGVDGYPAIESACNYLMQHYDSNGVLPESYPVAVWRPLMCEAPMGTYAELLARFAIVRGFKNILEFGSGMEAVTNRVRAASVGPNIVPTDIRHPRTPWDIRKAYPNALPGLGFDAAIGCNVLHTIDDPDRQQAVQNIADTLAVGGTMAVVEGDPSWPLNAVFPIEGWYDIGGFSNELQWVSLMEKAGLQHVSIMRMPNRLGALIWGTK